jgi:hypothetical protein
VDVMDCRRYWSGFLIILIGDVIFFATQVC